MIWTNILHSYIPSNTQPPCPPGGAVPVSGLASPNLSTKNLTTCGWSKCSKRDHQGPPAFSAAEPLIHLGLPSHSCLHLCVGSAL
ncbi:Ap-3 Complex Subunit Beta-2 [Manis pentadactyla]|nr:Ap-3 Complex Subunit Beta-2 [Manis pentadactyla]